MQFRALVLTSATLLAVVPAMSYAATETSALNACGKAFATSLAAPGAAAPSFKVSYRGGGSSAVADYYAHGFTFTLNAFDPKTRLLMARATCTTDGNGQVIALSATPIEGSNTLLTAQR